MVSDRDTFGSNLRSLRKERGLTLRALAIAAEIDHSYLSKIENGKRSSPSRKLCKRIASALSLKPLEIDQFLKSGGYSMLSAEEEIPETMPLAGRDILVRAKEELRRIFCSDCLTLNGKDSLLGLLLSNIEVTRATREALESIRNRRPDH